MRQEHRSNLHMYKCIYTNILHCVCAYIHTKYNVNYKPFDYEHKLQEKSQIAEGRVGCPQHENLQYLCQS